MKIDAFCPKCGAVMEFKYARVIDETSAVIDTDCPECNTIHDIYIEASEPLCRICQTEPAFSGLCKGCEIARVADLCERSLAWAAGVLSTQHGEGNPYKWMTEEWHEFVEGYEDARCD